MAILPPGPLTGTYAQRIAYNTATLFPEQFWSQSDNGDDGAGNTYPAGYYMWTGAAWQAGGLDLQFNRFERITQETGSGVIVPATNTLIYPIPETNSLAQFIAARASAVIGTAVTAALGIIRGTQTQASHNGSGQVAQLTGIRSNSQNSAGATVDLAIALQGFVGNNAAGIITTAEALRLQIQAALGTITTAQGIYIFIGDSLGTITNLAGIAIDALATVTNRTYLLLGTGTPPSGRYAIYSNVTDPTYFAGPGQRAQIATPSNPPAGTDAYYFKSDDKLYSLTSAGVETLVGPGLNPTPTRGAVIVGNSTPAFAAVTVGAAGTVVRSDGTDTSFSNIMVTQTVVKTADETLNNSGTLQNDDELLLAINASESWEFEFHVQLKSINGNGFKWGVTAPTSPTYETAASMTAMGTSVGGGSTQTPSTAFGGTTGSGTQQGYAIISYRINNGANAGTVTLQWAQNAPSANLTTVYKGSYLVARRTA